MTAVTQGFATAVLPLSGVAISTDSHGLIAGDVSVPNGDFQVPAYRAMPAAGASFPVVLVVQEIFGVHEHIRDVCRRPARAGYLAVAPSLYDRQGDVSRFTDFTQNVSQVVTLEYRRLSGRGPRFQRRLPAELQRRRRARRVAKNVDFFQRKWSSLD